MLTIPTFHAHGLTTEAAAYVYQRVGECWTTWICQGVIYRWQGATLVAEVEGLSWRYDPFTHQWVRFVERAA
jgi:hypothetical protein